MQAVRRIVGMQKLVLLVVPPEQHRSNADASIDQYAQSQANLDDAPGNDSLEIIEAIDQPIKEESRGKDHASLEPAPGAEIAVKLNVETCLLYTSDAADE